MTVIFEEQYADVLQNMEFALMSTCKEHPEVCDHEVARVVEAAINFYKNQRSPNLSALEFEMFERLKSMCDLQKGKTESSHEEIEFEVKSNNEIILCLKRIHKSIQFWTKRGGRHGYINFVTPRVFIG